MANRYLLDTQAWFWFVTGHDRLPRDLVASLEEALGEGQVYMSQISTWEMALKASVGKIDLARPVELWLRENTAGISMLDLPLEVVVESTRLPGTFHKDPADRFIVATARVHDLVLVTSDKDICAYARHGHVKVAAI